MGATWIAQTASRRTHNMHAPDNYDCPFCRLLAGHYGERAKQLVYLDDQVAVFPAKHHKVGNEGNLLVVPRVHIENLYDMPADLAEPLFNATQLAAKALKSLLGCDGITIRQNNEPAGGQDVWHYHVHVVPRYEGDNFLMAPRVIAPEAGREDLAENLKREITHIQSQTSL